MKGVLSVCTVVGEGAGLLKYPVARVWAAYETKILVENESYKERKLR